MIESSDDILSLMDLKIMNLTQQSMQDAKDGRWELVAESLRELAFICKKKGLFYAEFLTLRKELILAMESFNPMAKTYLELAERKKHGIIIH